jgi:hypothetical protein
MAALRHFQNEGNLALCGMTPNVSHANEFLSALGRNGSKFRLLADI